MFLLIMKLLLEFSVDKNRKKEFNNEKNLKIVLAILVEVFLLSILAYITGWKVIYTIFFGSTVIFGVIWTFSMITTESSNILNASIKGWTGQGSGKVKQFNRRMSAVTFGIFLTMIASFVLVFVKYFSYFFN